MVLKESFYQFQLVFSEKCSSCRCIFDVFREKMRVTSSYSTI